ncbi:MAG: hypothetical protein LIP77_05195, partial [Planctomycetes bacterium]|nr:hypothetical protein [Planctomycetota bacterium]
CCCQLQAEFRQELRSADGKPDPATGTIFEVTVSLSPAPPAERVLAAEAWERILTAGLLLPDGVLSRDPDFPGGGMVETSANLALVRTRTPNVEITVSVRSASDSRLAFVTGQIHQLAAVTNAAVQPLGSYPAWQYAPESPLRRLLADTYFRLFGRRAAEAGIHAGLECGVFDQAFRDRGEHLDMVSLGPDITGAHSPEESVGIASTGRVWEWLLATMAALAAGAGR